MMRLTERLMDFLKPLDDALRIVTPVFKALLVFTLIVTAWMFTDRDAPFAVLSVEPAAARPGELVTIRANVRRDVHRKCSVSFSRAIFDRHGTRVEDLGGNVFTAGMIEELERRTPGRLAVRIRVPADMEPGQGELVSSLEYTCNRTHVLLPIPVVTTMPFTVLP